MEGFVHPDFAPVTEKVQKITAGRRASGGMAVAVYHHGELVVDVWTGVRSAAGEPWARDTMATSFSTTKGVVATIVHRLVDRGLLDYDATVASYWPEFAAVGKEQITLRHLLTHQSAMHDVRRLANSTQQLLDWDYMVTQLAAAPPVWDVGVRSGYHALTYGWLVGEVIRRVTGLTIDEAFQREVVEPLGLDGGMHVGAPESVRDRIARGLASHNSRNPASSRALARALWLHEPPSIDANEITDKGYINQRAVLTRRAAAVDELYSGSEAVILPAR